MRISYECSKLIKELERDIVEFGPNEIFTVFIQMIKRTRFNNIKTV